MIKTAIAINSFASSGKASVVTTPESPSIDTFSNEMPLESRVDLSIRLKTLENIIATLTEKIAYLEATQDAQAENELNLLRIINGLRHTPKEDSPILDELYREMKALGRKQVDFATGARMVHRSKARLFQLKGAIALDQRFILIPSENHSQKLIIRLREFYTSA